LRRAAKTGTARVKVPPSRLAIRHGAEENILKRSRHLFFDQI
jgi:hypothetical protein